MKIVLVSLCRKVRKTRIENRFSFSIENLGLGFLASSCYEVGIQVDIIDAYALQLDNEVLETKLLEKLDDDDILGLSVIQSTVQTASDLARRMRTGGFNGRIIIGGWAVALAPFDAIESIPDATLGITGESENILPLIAKYPTITKFEDILGVIWRNGPNLIYNGKPTFVDLTNIPRPFHYLNKSPQHSKTPLGIQRSRGCSYGVCTFCSTAARYGKLKRRTRLNGHVLEEISFERRSSERPISFIDDDFIGRNKNGAPECHKFIKELYHSKIKMNYSIDCRIDDIIRYPNLFKDMQQTGLSHVFVGVESYCSKSLRLYRKGYSCSTIDNALEALSSSGIDVCPGFIPFDPYLSLNEIYENLRFLILQMKCTDNGMITKCLYPIKGTRMFERLEKDNLLLGSYPEFSMKYIDSRVPKFRNEIKQALQNNTEGKQNSNVINLNKDNKDIERIWKVIENIFNNISCNRSLYFLNTRHEEKIT